jgi:hypothetical protein
MGKPPNPHDAKDMRIIRLKEIVFNQQRMLQEMPKLKKEIESLYITLNNLLNIYQWSLNFPDKNEKHEKFYHGVRKLLRLDAIDKAVAEGRSADFKWQDTDDAPDEGARLNTKEHEGGKGNETKNGS